jgi:hypothetical protein
MKKITPVEIHYTCDLCGQKCEPVREVRLLHSWGLYGAIRNEILLKVSAYVPYGTTDGDVCPDCLREAIRRHFGFGKEGP